MSRPGLRAACLPLLLVPAALLTACHNGSYRRGADDAAMFGAQSMRIHPTFTRTKDWTGDGGTDGIEAVVELQDDFGEPTRATGRVMFEIYQYRPYDPDPRGKCSPGVWQWPLTSRRHQVAHWSRALRAYTFKIPFDPGRGTVVLAGQFALHGGTPRLFDQIILAPEGRAEPVPEPQTQPARRRRVPTTGPASRPAAGEELDAGELEAEEGAVPDAVPTPDAAPAPEGAPAPGGVTPEPDAGAADDSRQSPQ